ncbi:hypothetical protein GCM10011514_41170 [Emticicia aquatilis]|uniref:Uncharacterized protein n=1 Tax=Emticicia aquatilis TaxID=1537369 RepID=A0A916Z3J4_9BACT|nr:hypothetical protein [Emticicia aquatilis]GGD72845.1 hypothetical protein GCM10011514_41170 [Emticicia aquatilis]
MRRIKWGIFTVLIGLLPFFARLIIYLTIKNVQPIYLLNEIDLTAFGLVLHVTNLNDLTENYIGEEKWKYSNIGLCILFVIVYAFFLSITYFAEIDTDGKYADRNSIKICSFVLSLVSLGYSYWLGGVISNDTSNVVPPVNTSNGYFFSKY